MTGDRLLVYRTIEDAWLIITITSILSFVLYILIFPKGPQRIFKAGIAASVVPQLAGFSPMSVYAMYIREMHFKFSLGKGIFRGIFWTFFLYPHFILLSLLCLVVFIRHIRSGTESYKVEALIALFIATAGTAWIAIVGAWLTSISD
jgi:hypothetical protein